MNRVAIFERAFERAAQAWCTSSTRNIPMNVKLCEAFADILISSFAESAQEPVAEVTIEGVIGVKFFENCNYGCGLKVGDLQQWEIRAEHSGTSIELDNSLSIGREPRRMLDGEHDRNIIDSASEIGMADSDSDGLRTSRQRECRSLDTLSISKSMDNAEGVGNGSRSMPIGIESEHAVAASRGASMDDSHCAKWRQGAISGSSGEQRNYGERREAHGRIGFAGTPLDYASGTRSQGKWRTGGAAENGREISNGSTRECGSLFAPGPGYAGWSNIVAHQPWYSPSLSIEGERDAEAAFSSTESVLRGVADGLAEKLDFSHRAARLKCCGNGVVAAQAGLAFVVLARRAGIFE